MLSSKNVQLVTLKIIRPDKTTIGEDLCPSKEFKLLLFVSVQEYNYN